MSRVGVLGGTFNPPHIGHLVCAQDACDQLGLDEVLRLARLAVAGRDGVPREDIERAVAPFHDGSRLVFFEMPQIDVSSSMLRRRIAERRPVRHLVPDGVLRAIGEHGWYRDTATGAASARQEVQG